MADLKTDYKDDILDTSQNTKRKYQMIDNGDGTVSFEDVTEYLQQGDSFGADDINDTNEEVNIINDKLTCESYACTTDSNIAKAINDWIAQANMEVGETRRVSMKIVTTSDIEYIVEITKTARISDSSIRYVGWALANNNWINRLNFLATEDTTWICNITPNTATLAGVNSTSNKTFKNALLELKTTWDTLTIAEKVNTTLYYGNNILYPNTTSGIYSRVTLSTSALVVIVFNLSTGQALVYEGGTITNKTNNTLDANLALVGFNTLKYPTS